MNTKYIKCIKLDETTRNSLSTISKKELFSSTALQCTHHKSQHIQSQCLTVYHFMLINELILAMSEARAFIVNISNAHATVCYFLHEVQFVCF